MTLFRPTLKVNRLIVFHGGDIASDLRFHAGVNVIRGQNSSGKTTLMDLLAFSLGAENIRWKPEALACTTTLIEVELNGSKACLKRDIAAETQRPMSIFWGAIEAALGAPSQDWDLFPFRRSQHRISFSQALLDVLEMPLAQGDGASNLTMHQLLRVLYADQPSLHSPIFRADTFDTALTREMVGGYLSGVFDDELYSSQLRIRDVETELGKLDSELRGIFSVLGRSGQAPDLEFVNTKLEELEARRGELTQKLADVKKTGSVAKADGSRVREGANRLREELNAARLRDSQVKDELATVELEISDSLLFVSELDARLKNLDESKETRSYLGNMQFRFCPSCLSELSDARAREKHCHLCTTELDDGRGDSQILRMRNELSIQLKESKALLSMRARRVEELKRALPNAASRLTQLESDYKAASTSWSSEVELVVEETARAIGEVDEEIRGEHERQKLASVISELQERRTNLQKEQSRLEDIITALEQKQASRKVEVADLVCAALVRLLKLDLPRQVEFQAAREAQFSFTDNVVTVNGSRNFSESSAVVLRHLFHVALLTASTQKAYMRVPRFLMLDGIDDGGMEKPRSHRLQKIIVDECATYAVDYQVIFATSEISPELEDTAYVVDRFYSTESRSLAMR
jgi:hypothetical protein